MPRHASPDHGLILGFLRSAQGWKQAELAEAAGFSPRLVNDYERGRKPLYRDRLATLVAVLGLPPEVIDETLALLERARAASRAPRGPADACEKTRRRIETLAGEAGKLMSDAFRSLLTLATTESQVLQARQQAEALWARLAPRSAEERRALVDHPMLTLTRIRRKMDHLVAKAGAQVPQVVGVRRVESELVDEREEIGEGADRGERRRQWVSSLAASNGEQEGGFDEVKGDGLVAELSCKPAVVGRGPAGGRVGQPAVEVEETLDVGSAAAHEVRFRRAAASASLSRRL
jgi:transcriptional regulator with XRE-family HTH domain